MRNSRVFAMVLAGGEGKRLAPLLERHGERAIELYRKVLSIDPTNLAAAESLQTLFHRAERYGDMSLILQRKAEILEDVEAQKGALYQAAQLEEDVLERQENAIGVYLKILEIDGEDLLIMNESDILGILG